MFNVGRNNPRVRAALVEALELDPPGSRAARRLAAAAAPRRGAAAARAAASLERVLFTSSGTEAVEAAIKLGRAATGRTRVVSAEHGFHGLTLGALSASTASRAFTDRFGPLLPGFAHVPFGDLDALEARAAQRGRRALPRRAGPGKGVFLPAPGYLEGAQELCRRYGTLFCVDEVQTGLRPHRQALRVRALGARARPRHGREVALGRLRPGRGAC